MLYPGENKTMTGYCMFEAFFTTWWWAPVLFTTGIFVGINNVLAGGGSLISMPLLIFMGLDPAVANGSNRVAIAIQNVFAVTGFKSKGVGNARFSTLMILPALPGVILGAVLASTISGDLFKKILSIIMVVVLILILMKRTNKASSLIDESNLSKGRILASMLAFAGIGFYSGFIQAGVGFIVIGSMTLITGMDLVRINAHKVFIIGACTWVAVIVFAVYGKINWPAAMILAAGNAIGGWLGSLAAVAGGEKWIKRILVVAVLAMAFKLSGL